MPLPAPDTTSIPIPLPDIPALAVTAAQAAVLTPDGELTVMPHTRAQMLAHKQAVLVCHAPYVAARLGVDALAAFDVLELFAFVHPTAFCVPTPAGLAKALGLPAPQGLDDMPLTLVDAAQALLSDLQKEKRHDKKADPLEIARVMGMQGRGWAWTPYICAALGAPYDPAAPVIAKAALNIWKHLPEWSEGAPPPPPAHHAVTGEESRARLKDMLGQDAEARPEQVEYATQITAAFAPVGSSSPLPPSGGGTQGGGLSLHRQNQDGPPPLTPPPEGGRGRTGEHEPHVVLAEAGTGVGKTLGYLAPASVWAEKNDGPVWVSTYTRNLQRQIDRELDRLHPDPETKARKIAVRKGRENYLCLLNLEDETLGAATALHPDRVIAAGIMARWAGASRDGDLTGGDFPGWLAGILGAQHTLGLADRRGECIFSACDHYHRCFVERAARKARHADIVVANHALVMIQTALSGATDELPRRYVFDEGHHLFDAADGAFAGHLTARETSDLRRWLRGPEGGRRSRARGLKRRVEDLIENDAGAMADLDAILYEAASLPAFGWAKRLKENDPKGEAEKFLALVHRQVFSRADGRDGPYSLETDTQPLIDGLNDSAQMLKRRLAALRTAMKALAAKLRQKLADQADTLDTDTRKRLESSAAALERRAETAVGAWIDMLQTLQFRPAEEVRHVDWMEIERAEGRSVDVGLYRHWIDPTRPFAAALKPHAHGVAITSATLRNGGTAEEDWLDARAQTGADYLSIEPKTFGVASPFDYAAQTKVFIVNDVRRDDMDQVASAYRVLFEAAGGGGLGLFTSIRRLRAVHGRIAAKLETAGIPLYAQHVDGMDTGTLVDIFRDEIHACLLGTDAVRDGVDVPGESLRLLVYDRVPWPRPTILHRARRREFGGKAYDERLTRLKLRQAYGRLVRRAGDTGVFVMMDPMMPSRLHNAFPEGVDIVKTGLKEVSEKIRVFLQENGRL